jgi:hypothetical protein
LWLRQVVAERERSTPGPWLGPNYPGKRDKTPRLVDRDADPHITNKQVVISHAPETTSLPLRLSSGATLRRHLNCRGRYCCIPHALCGPIPAQHIIPAQLPHALISADLGQAAFVSSHLATSRGPREIGFYGDLRCKPPGLQRGWDRSCQSRSPASRLHRNILKWAPVSVYCFLSGGTF